ncbi:hypothetical protein [Kribbella solani]|uniref:hypothetical protein n=1 Tax=Kribbella solani TaxID=236067 RepID=UPI00160EDDAE|nr:hypothetical protein [Kribbella solani]MDX3003917.1 hypothetical protein [Kribbella solani]
MLRPLVATTAVTAALILVAGCGGNDKKADSPSGDGNGQSSASPSPTAPSLKTFDPPKTFMVDNAFPVPADKTLDTYDTARKGMVGHVALIGHRAGITGHDVADPSKTWMIKSTETATTSVEDMSQIVAVKVDGKDVALVAYSQVDKGNGTKKPQGVVVFQWIDVSAGQKLAEVATPVSTVEGTGTYAAGSPGLGSFQYDPETGQVAIGVSARGLLLAKTQNATVYADPKTKKSTVVPGVIPGALRNGVFAGSAGTNGGTTPDSSIVIVDGASGKTTKKTPVGQSSLGPLSGGIKHGYFYGSVYSTAKGTDVSTLYSVDLATGAVVKTVPGLSARDSGGYGCTWDQASAIVCTASAASGPKEIFGFDDDTGKKAWGYTTLSGGRIVPNVTAAFHGILYAQTEAQPVLMDAKTGADLPSGTPSGGPSSTPSDGSTPTDGATPSSGDTPSDSGSPSEGGNGKGDLGLFNGKSESPEAVSPYGGIYGQLPSNSSYGEYELIAIYLKPTA